MPALLDVLETDYATLQADYAAWGAKRKWRRCPPFGFRAGAVPGLSPRQSWYSQKIVPVSR